MGHLPRLDGLVLAHPFAPYALSFLLRDCSFQHYFHRNATRNRDLKLLDSYAAQILRHGANQSIVALRRGVVASQPSTPFPNPYPY